MANHEVQLPWLQTREPISMTKNQWGPIGWAWLHTQAINYPQNPTKFEQIAMFTRFWSFIQTLPCIECRIHATNYTRIYPPDFSGSIGFQIWAWRFHNMVNYRLDKPLMSVNEYRRMYMNY